MEQMASLTPSRSMGMDTRVRDYLDDKIQTSADFEGLDALLQQARNQQKLLKEQVWISTYQSPALAKVYEARGSQCRS